MPDSEEALEGGKREVLQHDMAVWSWAGHRQIYAELGHKV